MKKIMILIVSMIFFSNIYSQSFWIKHWNDRDKHPTRQIIIGCAFSALGVEGIGEGIAYAQSPEYNYPAYRAAKFQSIETTIFAGGLVASGIFLIVRGVKIKKAQKLKVGITQNGFGLIYKL